MVKSFLSTSASLLANFSCCLEQLLCRKPAPASEKRNFTVDVILGVLNTGKAESCSFQVCKFLIRNRIRDLFLENFCTLKKFGWEFVFSSTVNCML